MMYPVLLSIVCFIIACSAGPNRKYQNMILKRRGLRTGTRRKIMKLKELQEKRRLKELQEKRRLEKIVEQLSQLSDSGQSNMHNQCIESMVKIKKGKINKKKFRRPSLCNNDFRIHFIPMEPYSDEKFKILINKTFKLCCGTEKEMQIKQAESLASANVVYPVFGDTRSDLVYGYFFIPLINPPGLFYVTVKKRFHLSHLVAQCLQLWPIFVLSITLAFVTGFLVWLMETRRNREHFPRTFFRGWFEGVWFSFVFMTPVGFGNTEPKSAAGRLFSIFFILVGMFTFQILAAELTTIILKANTVERLSMAGANVGVMSNRFYDSTIVTHNGGFCVDVTSVDREAGLNQGDKGDKNEELQELYKLVSELRAGRLDGFVLDKHTYRKLRECIVSWNTTQGHVNDVTAQFFLHSTMVTDIPHSGGDSAYGILMKRKLHHKFFAPVFQSSRLMFQSNLSMRPHSSDDVGDKTIMNIYREVFQENIWLVGLAIGSIVCFGGVFEVHRKMKKMPRKKRRRRRALQKHRHNP